MMTHNRNRGYHERYTCRRNRERICLPLTLG